MRHQILAVLALSAFIFLPSQVKGQVNNSSIRWPYLGSYDKAIDEGRPRFIIEHQKLELAKNVSNPLGVTRCDPSSEGCFLGLGDFFSELKGSRKESFFREVEAGSRILRPGIMMHHYPHALFAGHYLSTGTYVFYLPKQKVFYLWGDCAMGHADELAGPYAGDPRLVLKKLAEDPDSVALLGYLRVPFQGQGPGQDSSIEAWPAIPSFGIDISKLARAQNVFNPLSLDRCRDSSEECVMNLDDFSSTRRNQLGKHWVLRRDVIAHYYPGYAQQYVFYLPRQNIFYVTGGPSATGHLVSGPFAGDPKLALKKLIAGAN